ncbi:hypothetical protein BCR36DRAFT_588383 [Piromyces finnis]|uniref:Uncharacterized protein n=1 Tax=Piromyces finnis TaxID=1754191 RepID=A0A1Y1UHI4_9FUNG|nr:hypothetical protein BCR36DRAFT_588383 [Piromyces finnis]|eukprot:ORX37508.1 hypothetical protein BCR36DRAFT_588383 [Piromyces finnis]
MARDRSYSYTSLMSERTYKENKNILKVDNNEKIPNDSVGVNENQKKLIEEVEKASISDLNINDEPIKIDIEKINGKSNESNLLLMIQKEFENTMNELKTAQNDKININRKIKKKDNEIVLLSNSKKAQQILITKLQHNLEKVQEELTESEKNNDELKDENQKNNEQGYGNANIISTLNKEKGSKQKELEELKAKHSSFDHPCSLIRFDLCDYEGKNGKIYGNINETKSVVNSSCGCKYHTTCLKSALAVRNYNI